ncbi:hypothetical protein C4J81_09365 [Deltaproteobacteria bacterium Smac51]|nr:hypothetical protein C4J81_09365 [Deltaproteobacteria bacterium Smac51]
MTAGAVLTMFLGTEARAAESPALFAPAESAPPAPLEEAPAPVPPEPPSPASVLSATPPLDGGWTVEVGVAGQPVPETPAEVGTTLPAPDSPYIQLDKSGGKTLVIRGDDDPQAPKGSAGGTSSPGIFIDSQGRKTLILRDDDTPVRLTESKGAQNKAEPTAAEATAVGPASAPEREKPYWVVEKKEAERPYFLREKLPVAAPYWKVEKGEAIVPYWRVTEKQDNRPYWLAWKPEPEPVPEPPAPPVTEVKAAAAETAADSGRRVISYYMFQDERGVKHLTNAPADPRYRLFTAEVRVTRGLAPKNTRFTHKTLQGHIMDAAAIYNLDPALIAAVIKSESAFDSQAVSWAGAQGLMQLMPGTARDMGCRDPFDPRQNIMGGSRYLRLMLNRFGGDVTLALAAYNAGPERVARRWRVPDIPETKNYVVIVMRNYDKYRGQF